MIGSLVIKPFPVKTATEDEYRAANVLNNAIRAERLPDDPPIPLDEMMQGIKTIPSFVDVHAWAVWNVDESVMVASTSLSFLLMETNKHIAEFEMQVLPEYRRQGIARKLLALVADTTRANQRTLLICNTNDRVPAGEAFVHRIGAQKGLAGHSNQLDLRAVDRDLVREWQARANERASDFEIAVWDGPYPEEYIHDIVDLNNVMNTAPHDDLQVDDFIMTPERLRQQERSFFARGGERWTMAVREKSTGKFAGFTEVVWNRNRPQILEQHGTGVFPQYRNHGLGRWLKAAMLDRVLRERPQVRFVRTGNADSNAAMLKINYEIGFKPFISLCMWQVGLDRVFDYLGKKEMAQT